MASRRSGKRRARGTSDELPSAARRVRVYAGVDPVSGRRHNLVGIGRVTCRGCRDEVARADRRAAKPAIAACLEAARDRSGVFVLDSKESACGEAAAGAGRTDTFLGERYRRIARRRGKKRAIVAVGRSMLIIIWHVLSDPEARYTDLGSDFYDTRINLERRKRNHVHQLEAMGYTVTVEPAA